MKRLFIPFVAALLLLPACKHEFKTETLDFEEEIPYSDRSEGKLEIDYEVEFPTDGYSKDIIAEMRKTIRVACFGDAYVDFTAPLTSLAESCRDVLTQEYRLSNEELLRELEIDEADAGFLNWGAYIEGKFVDPYHDYLCYHIERYAYYGGAHGTNSEEMLIIDPATGKAVPAETFLGNISKDRLIALINEYKYDNLADIINDGVGTDNIFYVDPLEPSENYSVDEEGFSYYYQPYEVAPYVFGVIKVTIPWEALNKE